MPIIEMAELQEYVDALEEDQAMDEYLVRARASNLHSLPLPLSLWTGGAGDGCHSLQLHCQSQMQQKQEQIRRHFGQ